MNNVEEYENTIAFLKQALEFYANQSNYREFNDTMLFPPIEIDNGFQARFALEQIQKLAEIVKNSDNEFTEHYANELLKDDVVDNTGEFKKIIDEYKNMLDGNN